MFKLNLLEISLRTFSFGTNSSIDLKIKIKLYKFEINIFLNLKKKNFLHIFNFIYKISKFFVN